MSMSRSPSSFRDSLNLTRILTRAVHPPCHLFCSTILPGGGGRGELWMSRYLSSFRGSRDRVRRQETGDRWPRLHRQP
jgi:hypothetical protein